MRLVFILLLTAFLPVALFAGTLHGLVTDNNNQPLPFANVYIQGTTKGTAANKEGRYSLELETGSYPVVFQYIGFARQVVNVEVSESAKELNVSLVPEEIHLQDVLVKPTEDPAYAIIREAIATRDAHYNAVESYRCEAYTKGLQRIVSAPDKIFGQSINFDGSLDSNNAGIIYLSESISELTFMLPDRVSETVISSKVSGDSKTFTWNRAGDFYIFNFYKNSIKLDFLSDRIFISPVSDNAMLYYRYRLDGTIEDNRRLIHKIELIPRRKHDPVFSGSVYIVDSTWEFHSLDLLLTKQNQMNFIDSLWLKQVYTPVNDSLWMQLSQWFEFNFEILNIKAEGYYGIVYSDYDLNPGLSKKDFTNEVLVVDENANQRDSLYWEKYRPVPLTGEEAGDYSRKDSIEVLKESKEYLKSIDRKNNKFSTWDLLLGYNYQNSYKKLFVRVMPLINGFQYNTVEGFNLKLTSEVRRELKEKKRVLTFEPLARYGFSNRHFNASLRVRFDYKPAKLGYVEAEGGNAVFQFNHSEPISELVNTAYSLFNGRNFMKIYEESFGALRHRIEIANGLLFWTGVNYSARRALRNSSRVSVKDGDKLKFTDNISFESHEAFTLSFTLQYRPGQKYITRPYEKINLGSKWPVFSFTWRKSIPGIFGSDLNYDQLEFKVMDDISVGMFGNMHYMAKAGTFVNTQRVELMDFKHFNGNQTIFGQHYRDGFQLLDYYAASTVNEYIEAHFQHNFEGFFFNKIPGIRRLKFQETFGAHFLYSKDFKDYLELSVGIENILRVIRVDFIFSISNRHSNEFGVTVGIDFGSL